MSLHPTQYAQVLNRRRQAANASAYLVNTGWNGSGQRISIRDTRAIIDAILSGELDESEMTQIPHFHLGIPSALSNVNSDILDPRNTYKAASQWDAKAQKLAQMFVDNFAQFTDTESGQAGAVSLSCKDGWRGESHYNKMLIRCSKIQHTADLT